MDESTACAKTGGYRIVGYWPSWMGNPDAIQYDKLTHINYAFLEATGSGAVGGETGSLPGIVKAAHAKGVKVLGSLGGWSNRDALGAVIRDVEKRRLLAENLVAFADEQGLDGIDVDWEGPESPADSAAYTDFIKLLRDPLSKRGMLLTAAFDNGFWLGDNFPSDSFAMLDFVNIMAYDNEGPHHSTLEWAIAGLDYWKGRGLDPRKTNLGLPFYGYPGERRGEEVAYNELVAGDPGAADRDFTNGVGYNGKATVAAKTRLAKDRAGGIMIWELAEDATGDASLVSVIFDILCKK